MAKKDTKKEVAEAKERTQFTTLNEALEIVVPAGKRMVERWSDRDTGLGVRVMAGNNHRVWICRFTAERKNQKTNLKASFDGTVKSFNAARREAADIRARALARRAGSDSRTLAEAYAAYKELRGDALAPDTLSSYKKALEKVSADIAGKQMSHISVEMWEHEYLRLSSTRGKATARSVLRLANVLYKRELAKTRVSTNPIAAIASDIGLYRREKPRKRGIPRAALPAVWKSLELMHPSTRDYMRFLLFTGARKSIAGALRWDRLDVAKRSYFISKTDRGNKAKQDFHYPISDALWQLVFAPRLALKKDGEVWILPSTKQVGRPLHEPRGSFDFIELKTGQDVSAHSFRYTCATIAEAVVGSLVMVGHILMHTVAKTQQEKQTSDYVDVEIDAVRAAANRLGRAVLEYADARPKEEKPVPAYQG